MAERIQSVNVRIEVDTNRQDFDKLLTMDDGETSEEFAVRIAAAVTELMGMV